MFVRYITDKRIDALAQKIVRNRSLFLEKMWHAFLIYSFYRTVDNIVDLLPYPTNKHAFERFRDQYYALLYGTAYSADKHTNLIKAYIALRARYNTPEQCETDFFHAMAGDVAKIRNTSVDDLYSYVHESAEFSIYIWNGFFNLTSENADYFRYTLRGLAIAEMIYDIAEDHATDHVQFPAPDCDALSRASLENDRCAFTRIVRKYLLIANYWLRKAQRMVDIKDINITLKYIALSNIRLTRFYIKKIYDDPPLLYSPNRLKRMTRWSVPHIVRAYCMTVSIIFKLVFNLDHEYLSLRTLTSIFRKDRSS